jgi:surface antigen
VKEALAHERKDVSLPWENPKTGAHGTVTPLTSAYTTDGVLCRDFIASYVRGTSEAWLQGEACRTDPNQWEVRAMKPWKQS